MLSFGVSQNKTKIVRFESVTLGRVAKQNKACAF
jgi:hypothetical protein